MNPLSPVSVIFPFSVWQIIFSPASLSSPFSLSSVPTSSSSSSSSPFPLQSRGRRDPPWDLSALHPAAVLPGDVHNRDAQIHVPAGGAAASQEKYKSQMTKWQYQRNHKLRFSCTNRLLAIGNANKHRLSSLNHLHVNHVTLDIAHHNKKKNPVNLWNNHYSNHTLAWSKQAIKQR